MELPSRDSLGVEDADKSIFDDYINISINDQPPTGSGSNWAYPPMYKESQTGGTLYWRVGFDGTTDEIVTEHGYHTTSTGNKGKLQVDRLKIYTNNLHKTIITKAIQDARKAYDDKYKESYSDEAGNSIELPASQLGHPYKTQLKESHFLRGVDAQPKIDGIRARSWRIKGDIIIYSREFNAHPWLTSIRKELQILFNYLPQGVGIDGELYSHEFSFQILTSAVKTYKTLHPLNESVMYYIFDLILLETDLETRSNILRDAYLKATGLNPLPHLVLLGHSIIHNPEHIKVYHDAYVKDYGYEGVILRKILGSDKVKDKRGNPRKLTKKEIEETWYKPGKNNNMLKVKEFIDEEGTVVDIVEGEGRESGLAIIRIRDIRSNTFDVRPRGSFEKRRKWLEEKSKYIGKPYTFRYFELSDYNIPRFPVGIAFRTYE